MSPRKKQAVRFSKMHGGATAKANNLHGRNLGSSCRAIVESDIDLYLSGRISRERAAFPRYSLDELTTARFVCSLLRESLAD